MSTRTPLPTVNERDTENVSAAGVEFAAGASFARPVEGLRGRRGGFAFVRDRGRTEVPFGVTPGASFVSGEGSTLPFPPLPSGEAFSGSPFRPRPRTAATPRWDASLPSLRHTRGRLLFPGRLSVFPSCCETPVPPPPPAVQPLGNISGVSSSAVGLPVSIYVEAFQVVGIVGRQWASKRRGRSG